jgi:hypothetical protein
MTSELLPTLSFRAQPSLRALFATLTDSEDPLPLTLVCGAGVSRNAGLPDWRELIDRMAEAVRPSELSDVVREDPVDPMRKVDYVLRLKDPSKSEADVIRDCLYRDVEHDAPGLLAESIAQLAAGLSRPVRLITTNYDNQLELALRRYVDPPTPIESYGLSSRDIRRWRASDAPSVLHVHGMVVRGDSRVIEPLILSESYYLLHGPEVRDVIRRALLETHVLFVGVSMTDPNLIGPLHDLREDAARKKAFLIVVPDPIPGEKDPRLINLYWRKRSEYLEAALDLDVVLLPAYGEVQQILYDLILAEKDRGTYFSNDPASSSRYGHRLTRSLDRAYGTVNSAPNDDTLDGPQQGALSDSLFEELWKADGPGGLLTTWRTEMPSDWLEEYGVDHSYFEEEGLALFLWLKARSRRPEVQEVPPYALRLIGTSAYSHRERWSSRRELPIRPGQSFQTDAAYFGTPAFNNLDDGRQWRLWLSAVATPIRWASSNGFEDILILGVLTLNSQRRFVDDVGLLRSEYLADLDVRRHFAPSAISFLDNDKKDEILKSLQRVAGRVLGMPGAD